MIFFSYSLERGVGQFQDSQNCQRRRYVFSQIIFLLAIFVSIIACYKRKRNGWEELVQCRIHNMHCARELKSMHARHMHNGHTHNVYISLCIQRPTLPGGATMTPLTAVVSEMFATSYSPFIISTFVSRRSWISSHLVLPFLGFSSAYQQLVTPTLWRSFHDSTIVPP